jgi:dihydrodipicolinate synthase/N-acetylneuraminate lyase
VSDPADTPFGGVQPVLQIPFADAPGQPILVDELVDLVEYLVGCGVDGLVVPGLASESWALTEAERELVIEVAAQAIAGRARMIVGIDGTTAVAADRARGAVERGASGLMVLPPSTAGSGDAGLVRHFQTVAEAGGVPLLLQDSPQVSGVNMTVDLIVSTVAAHPLITSLKAEIPGSGPRTSAAHAAGVEIVAGWGGVGYLEQVERGAAGCMPGSDLGPALLSIDRSIRRGDIVAAHEMYRRILPLLAFETQSLQLLVLSAKRHLRRRGVFSTESMREPARGLDEGERTTVDRLLEELAMIGVDGFAS